MIRAAAQMVEQAESLLSGTPDLPALAADFVTADAVQYAADLVELLDEQVYPRAEAIGQATAATFAQVQTCRQSLDALAKVSPRRRSRDELRARRDELGQLASSIERVAGELGDVVSMLAPKNELVMLRAWFIRLRGWLLVAARCCEVASNRVADELRASWLKRYVPFLYEMGPTFWVLLCLVVAVPALLPRWWASGAVVLLWGVYLAFRVWVTRGPAPSSLSLEIEDTSTGDTFDVDSAAELDAVIDGLQRSNPLSLTLRIAPVRTADRDKLDYAGLAVRLYGNYGSLALLNDQMQPAQTSAGTVPLRADTIALDLRTAIPAADVRRAARQYATTRRAPKCVDWQRPIPEPEGIDQ